MKTQLPHKENKVAWAVEVRKKQFTFNSVKFGVMFLSETEHSCRRHQLNPFRKLIKSDIY